MGMTRRQKLFVGVAALGLGVVGLDRVFVLPGPATASAAGMVAEVRELLDLSKLEARATGLVTATIEAELLGAMSQGEPGFDAFSPEGLRALQAAMSGDGLAGETPLTEKVVETKSPQRGRIPSLTAVVSRGAEGIAVLDGKTLSVGESRDGVMLVRVTARSATVRVEGREYTLSLPVAGNLQKSGGGE
jgi:hypothetical protein